MKNTAVVSMAVIVILVILAIPTRAQEKPAPEPAAKEPRVTKVIKLKYADPNRVRSLLTYFGANMQSDPQLKAITIVGWQSAVEAAEEAIKKLDVPPPPSKDVDLTAYILLATRQPAEGSEIPTELRDVVAQLKKVLNYQSFRILNSALIRTKDGEGGGVTGLLSGGGANQNANFRLDFSNLSVIPEEKSSIVRIDRLNFHVHEEERASEGKSESKTKDSPLLASISTNIDVPEGQKVVVGKTAFQLPENALVLVLTAKVVD